MNIRLFIEGKEVELNDNVRFAITREFEDINNPTHIINDFSKTVEIPFSVSNNKLFGYIYNPNRMVVEQSGDETMGLYFDASKKLNFQLFYNNTTLMQGYAKMDSIKHQNGNGVYCITLNGQLGKLFQEMQQLTFDTKDETNEDYWIDGSKYVSEYINKELVASSFDSEQQQIELSGASFNDIIGFVPSTAYNEEFNSDNVELIDNRGVYKGIMEFKTILEEKQDFVDAGVSADSLIGDGLLPRQYGEFRSYYQQPYIYFNKLMQIFANEVKDRTGYSLECDKEWFNNSNPYWKDLVYMLKPLNVKDGDTIENTYDTRVESLVWGNEAQRYVEMQNALFNYLSGTSIEQRENVMDFDSNEFIMSDDYVLNGNTTMKFVLQVPNYNQEDIYISRNNALIIYVLYVGDNDEVINYTTNIFANKNTHYDISDYDNAFLFEKGEHKAYYTQFSADLPFDFSFNKKQYGDRAKIIIKGKWLSLEEPFYRVDDRGREFGYRQSLTSFYAGSFDLKTNVLYDIKRTNTHFTLNDLWNSEYNLFNEILKYCKLFRLTVTVDDVSKKWKIERFVKYFRRYSIDNKLGNNVNFGEDFVITPVTFDSKYVLFNYKDSDLSLNEKYKEKYGLNYGEFRLISDYNFNTDTKELFEKTSNPSIVYTDNILDWNHIYNADFVYLFPKETYVLNSDKDRQKVDVFGSLFFRNGFASFNPELRGCKVTDDTIKQLSLGKYCYTDLPYNSITVYKYPKLDIVKDDVLCVFNPPMESYVYGVDYSDYSGIYDLFWNKYINERYNIQNNKLDCKMRLNNIEYMGFDFNHFINFNNRLYMVNKIRDYDVQSTSTTNVELISVSDISGYTKDRYEYLIPRSDFVELEGGSGEYYLPFDTNTQINSIDVIPDEDYYGTLHCYDDNGKLGFEWEHFDDNMENATGKVVVNYGVYGFKYTIRWHIDGTV